MITQYKIALGAVANHRLYSDSAYRLYAYLLEQLPFDEADWLHESGVVCQFLTYEKEKQRYLWTLNLLSDETAQVLRPVLDGLQVVTIENQSFPVLEQTLEEIRLEDLMARGREETDRRTSVRFCTLTAFKQNGRYVIFPQERLILQSLILRWNEVFPQCPLEDEDAFQALLSGLHIVDYRLSTSRFLLKGVRIPGFTGSCLIEAKLALPLLELWNTLVAFANYAGIGIKTGLGMGGVCAQPWSANKP